MLLLKASTKCTVCNISRLSVFAITTAYVGKVCFISTPAAEFNTSTEMFWFVSISINYNTARNYYINK